MVKGHPEHEFIRTDVWLLRAKFFDQHLQLKAPRVTAQRVYAIASGGQRQVRTTRVRAR